MLLLLPMLTMLLLLMLLLLMLLLLPLRMLLLLLLPLWLPFTRVKPFTLDLRVHSGSHPTVSFIQHILETQQSVRT